MLGYCFQFAKFTHQFPFLLQLLMTDGFAKENREYCFGTAKLQAID
jgi:hypothetical protein